MRRRAWWCVAGLVVMTGVKFVVASSWGATAEVPQMANQAEAFLAGRDVLEPQSTYGNPSFFPLGHYLLITGCWLLAQAMGLPFAFVIKAPAILADLVVSLLLRTTPKGGEAAALLYMFNPVTFLLSAYHGQPHTVALAGAVLSLWCAPQGRTWLSGVGLGLAAGIRQHFAMLILPFLRHKMTGRVALIVAFALVMLPLSLPMLLGSQHAQRLLAPTWTYGSWGYTMILLQGPRLLALLGLEGVSAFLHGVNQVLLASGRVFYWMWAGYFAIWVWRRRAVDRWRAALLFFLGLYAISPGFGIQWLIWALPFWLVVDRHAALIYSVLAGAFLAGSYWQWSLNDVYGVSSLTANLSVLRGRDLACVILVGGIGVLTWGYAARAAWRLARG